MKTVWCATGVLALGVVWENNGSRVCEKVQTVSAVCAFFCLGCFSQCLWLLSRSHRQCHIIPSFQQRHTDLYGQSGAGQGNVRLCQYYDKKKGKLHTSCCTEHLCIIPETGKNRNGKNRFQTVQLNVWPKHLSSKWITKTASIISNKFVYNNVNEKCNKIVHFSLTLINKRIGKKSKSC